LNTTKVVASQDARAVATSEAPALQQTPPAAPQTIVSAQAQQRPDAIQALASGRDPSSVHPAGEIAVSNSHSIWDSIRAFWSGPQDVSVKQVLTEITSPPGTTTGLDSAKNGFRCVGYLRAGGSVLGVDDVASVYYEMRDVIGAEHGASMDQIDGWLQEGERAKKSLLENLQANRIDTFTSQAKAFQVLQEMEMKCVKWIEKIAPK
jgi:hypothetical protein